MSMHACVQCEYFIIRITWLTKYHQGITLFNLSQQLFLKHLLHAKHYAGSQT